ncbi:response regulator transcription factor [Deinococcus xianganensis]|uniref:Response regulator n=1 Tax=Deinococcus xianganensis TaxID=1507289 RepID=A0A6I4YQK2_9DEIO|nr:response regulator transcription factor [Deinococcus xianganensis]MXV21986.1 response regulator [Deinococcus xianganensis]
MSGPKLLVIEDDPGIRRLLLRGLRFEGFEVTGAEDGPAGLDAAQVAEPDLVLLDVMLPGLSGLDVVRALREQGRDVPVILLTARTYPEHQIDGFEAGADDYVTKPFTLDVLVARIRAHLRRRAQETPEALSVADVTLYPAQHRVTRGGVDVPLTAQEFRVLQVFMAHPGQVLSKSVLLDRAWGDTFLGDPSTVETYVKVLRQKLEQAGGTRLIHTVRGAGYVLRAA